MPAGAHILGNVMMVCPVLDLDTAHAEPPLLCSFICASRHVSSASADINLAYQERPPISVKAVAALHFRHKRTD